MTDTSKSTRARTRTNTARPPAIKPVKQVANYSCIQFVIIDSYLEPRTCVLRMQKTGLTAHLQKKYSTSDATGKNDQLRRLGSA